MDEGNPLIIRTHCHQYLHPFICLYLSLACTYQASSVFVLALHFCVLTIFLKNHVSRYRGLNTVIPGSLLAISIY